MISLRGYALITSLDRFIVKAVDDDEMIVLAEVKFHELRTIAVYGNSHDDAPVSYAPFFNELLGTREEMTVQIKNALFDWINDDEYRAKIRPVSHVKMK